MELRFLSFAHFEVRTLISRFTGAHPGDLDHIPLTPSGNIGREILFQSDCACNYAIETPNERGSYYIVLELYLRSYL